MNKVWMVWNTGIGLTVSFIAQSLHFKLIIVSICLKYYWKRCEIQNWSSHSDPLESCLLRFCNQEENLKCFWITSKNLNLILITLTCFQFAFFFLLEEMITGMFQTFIISIKLLEITIEIVIFQYIVWVSLFSLQWVKHVQNYVRRLILRGMDTLQMGR